MAGVGAEALAPGRALPACVRSIEDHGFTLSLGIAVRGRCLRHEDTTVAMLSVDIEEPQLHALLFVLRCVS